MVWAERSILHARARVSGIASVVRWLRNPNPALVAEVLRRHGAAIGDGTTFKGALFFDNVTEDQDSAGDFSHLSIGSNVYIGDAVYFDLAGRINIADNAIVSARATLITHRDLNRSGWLAEQIPRRCGAVTVCDGASLFASATMLADSTLAPESLLAAGALLGEGRATEPRTIWGGVPARQLRRLAAATDPS